MQVAATESAGSDRKGLLRVVLLRAILLPDGDLVIMEVQAALRHAQTVTLTWSRRSKVRTLALITALDRKAKLRPTLPRPQASRHP